MTRARILRVQDRDQLQQDLAKAGIGTAIHYPVPLHLQTAYAKLGYRAGDFPVTERCAAEIVSLPMYPGLRGTEQKRVAQGVQAFLEPISVCAMAVGSGS